MKNIMEQFDGYTSDQVRLALRSIPTDIALSLTEDQLVDLIKSIMEFGKFVAKEFEKSHDAYLKRMKREVLHGS